MAGLATAFNTILDKFGKFLGVLDLSYFISGGVAVSALVWWARQSKVDAPKDIGGLAAVGGTLLGFYVAGLICFAAGRLLRLSSTHLFGINICGGRRRRKRPACDDDDKKKRIDCIRQAALSHGLQGDALVKRYLGKSAGGTAQGNLWGLYARLWAEARQNQKLKESLEHLNGFWIRSATYDGLAVALLVWTVALYFVYMHGPVPLGFQAHDIKEPKLLACRLHQHIDDPSTYLYCQLTTSYATPAEERLKKLIDDYDEKNKPSAELMDGMVYMLNKAVKYGELQDCWRFRYLDLCYLTRYVLRRETGTGTIRRKQNRLLLEAAYPGILRPHSKPYYAPAGAAIIAILVLVLGCLAEAHRHFRNQVEELFATYAWWKDNLPKPGAGNETASPPA